MESFDFVVIGGGSAGYAAASTAARAGLSVAVIEGGAEVGGLCILRGCMPSKTLLASAARAAAVRGAAEFGVQAWFLGVDGEAIQARKRLLIDDFAGYRKSQLESGRFTFLRGHARFRNPHTLEVEMLEGESRSIHANTFLIATGSRSRLPEIPGLLETGALDSDAMLASSQIPRSVTVLGGGAIALEAATYYAGLGAEVTLLQRSNRLLKDADPDVSEAVAEGLRHHGIRVETGTRLLSALLTDAGKVIRFEQNNAVHEVVSEEILCALGRFPNTHSLGLEAAGVCLRGAHLEANLCQQTAQSHIFAAGDVCGPLEVVHIAIQQGEVAARNAVRLLRNQTEPLEAMDYRLKMLGIFSEPDVAYAGLTEAEAAAAGIPVLTASYPFNDHGKSMVEGHTQGFVKLLAHAETRAIVGAAVVGPMACELLHEVVVAMHFHATAGDLARIPHYHPTLSEIWTYPAEELA